MLNSMDIREKCFKKSFRGYDKGEVDEFLDEIIKDFETLYSENFALKQQLGKEREALKSYKDIEVTLQKTMVLAQKTAEETRQKAEEQAETIIMEAEKHVQQMLDSAHREIIDFTKRQELLKNKEKQLKTELRDFLTSHLKMIDNDPIEENEPIHGAEASEGKEYHFSEIAKRDRDRGRISILERVSG